MMNDARFIGIAIPIPYNTQLRQDVGEYRPACRASDLSDGASLGPRSNTAGDNEPALSAPDGLRESVDCIRRRI